MNVRDDKGQSNESMCTSVEADLAGMTFGSRAEIVSLDSWSYGIRFMPEGKVTVTEYGAEEISVAGKFHTEKIADEIRVFIEVNHDHLGDMPKWMRDGHRWPEMILKYDKGVPLLFKADDDTSLFSDRADDKESHSYWPFTPFKNVESHDQP